MQSQKEFKRIVIKLGSSLFYREGVLDNVLFAELARQVAKVVNEGREVVLVSSGAIALGMSLLKLKQRPNNLNLLQAVAAIGQPELMDVYRKFFKQAGLNCAQLLLTWDDFSNRNRYLNAKNTITTLLKLKIIPIINENDTVSTCEIKFGDNDRLSSLVATMIGADLLLMLSDVDGLLDKEKKVIPIVDKITPQIKALASATKKSTSVGGMITKLEAASICAKSGILCVIANGRSKDIITSLSYNPFSAGTVFLTKQALLDARKRWMAFGSKTKGEILVDEGAKKALLDKKSLLAVGVLGCRGSFSCGDIIAICDNKGSEFARGKVSISAKELEKIKGSRFGKEVIHRDNLVVI